MGSNRELVGKKFPEKTYRVERKNMLAFARATNEDNPRIVAEDIRTASPMFGMLTIMPTFLEAVFHPLLLGGAGDQRMAIHGYQDMRFLGGVHEGDMLRTMAEILSIEQKGAGDFMTAVFKARNQDGLEVLSVEGGFFYRGPPDPTKPKKPAEPAEVPPLLFARTLHVDPDQTYRYAEVSGDRNPLHIDESFAKAMGFPTVVLHGLCTMAFAQKAILDGVLEGDPSRLKRLKVVFANPVFPNDDLTCQAWKLAPSSAYTWLGFRIINQRGEEVVRKGEAEVDRS